MECECCYEQKTGIRCNYNHFICLDCREKNGNINTCFICNPISEVEITENSEVNGINQVNQVNILYYITCMKEFCLLFSYVILSLIFVVFCGYYYKFIKWIFYKIINSDNSVDFNIIMFSIFDYIIGITLLFFTVFTIYIIIDYRSTT